MDRSTHLDASRSVPVRTLPGSRPRAESLSILCAPGAHYQGWLRGGPVQRTFVELPGRREKAYGKCPVLLAVRRRSQRAHTNISLQFSNIY